MVEKSASNESDSPSGLSSSRRKFMGAAGILGAGSVAGCLGNMNAASQQSGSQSNFPLATDYGDDDHLYDLPADPLTTPIPEPPSEPQSQGDMNLYMSQMMFLQNIYLREAAYALRELAQSEEIPTAPWVTDEVSEE